MQSPIGNRIKEEQTFCSIATTDERDAVGCDDRQKIILSPRTEMHRVLKSPPDELDQPPQIIYTSSRGSPLSHAQLHEQMSAPETTNSSLQRVQVIKDGRFYEEPVRSYTSDPVVYHSPDAPSSPPQFLHNQQQPPNHQIHHHHEEGMREIEAEKLHFDQQWQQQRKVIISRQINVISNVGDEDPNGGTTTVTPIPLPPPQPHQQPDAANGSNGTGVFRPPDVSSTSTPMRPPPPPPPPRIKGSSPEEPSSSIPDLGEFLLYKANYYLIG